MEIAYSGGPIKKKRINNLFVYIGIAIVVSLMGIGSYFYFQTQPRHILGATTQNAQTDTQSVREKIQAFMDLPAETPTIVTVADKSKVADQAFFKRAENGDQVLIFTRARKAILYRPATNRVIEVSVLSLASPSGELATESAESK